MTIPPGKIRRTLTIILMLTAPFIPLYMANALYMRFVGYAHHDVAVNPAPFMHTVLNYMHSFQLILVVAVFGIVGLLIIHSVKGFWFSTDASQPPVHAVFIGQLALLVYVYLRSYINYLVGVVIPITAVDVIAVTALLVFILYKKGEIAALIKGLNVNRDDYLITLYFIWLLFLIIANKELPRIAMLSSDADRDAFFVKQLLRFHTVPFTQFYWGNEPSHYPEGFAVLNFIWSMISSLDIRNVVTAQRLIQTQLAIVLLVECARSVDTTALLKKRVYFIFLCLIFCIYFAIFPDGFETVFFSQEHLPLFSTLLFAAMGLSFFFFIWIHKRDVHYRENLNVPLNTAVMVLMIGALMLIHPVTAFYAIIPYCLGIIVMWSGNKKRSEWIASAAVLPLAAFPLLDPYYCGILSDLLSPGAAAVGAIGISGFTTVFITSIADTFRGTAPILSLFQTGLLDNTLNVCLMALMVLSVLFVCCRRYVTWRYFSLIALAGLVLILTTVLMTGLLSAYTHSIPPRAPIAVAEAGGAPWYFNLWRLSSYVTMYASRCMIVWFFLGVGVALASLVQYFDYKRIVLGALLGILFVVIVSESHTERVNIFLPRKYMSGSYEEVTGDDLAVIKRIEGLFREYRETGGSLDYRTVPRILILNEVFIIDKEIWLLPRGASRILPLYDVFPVSFFYYQGMSLFSYENYMRHVHDTFDVGWLLDNNIRYLFIPSDRGGAVIEGLDAITENGKVLFEENDCVFIEITR